MARSRPTAGNDKLASIRPKVAVAEVLARGLDAEILGDQGADLLSWMLTHGSDSPYSDAWDDVATLGQSS
jgi:hypothetical protein